MAALLPRRFLPLEHQCIAFLPRAWYITSQLFLCCWQCTPWVSCCCLHLNLEHSCGVRKKAACSASGLPPRGSAYVHWVRP